MSQELSKKYKLAISYLQMYRFNECERLLKEIISEDPNYTVAYVMLAKAYFDHQKYKESFEIALIGRKNFNTYVVNFNSYLYLWYSQKLDLQKAENVLIETLDIEPNNSIALVHYMYILIKAGLQNTHRYKEMLDTVLKNHLQDSVVLNYLVMYMWVGLKFNIPDKEIISLYRNSDMDEYRKCVVLLTLEKNRHNYKDAYEYAYKAFEIKPNITSRIYNVYWLKFINTNRFYRHFFLIEKFIDDKLTIGIIALLISILLYFHKNQPALYLSILLILFTAYYFSIIAINRSIQRKAKNSLT